MTIEERTGKNRVWIINVRNNKGTMFLTNRHISCCMYSVKYKELGEVILPFGPETSSQISLTCIVPLPPGFIWLRKLCPKYINSTFLGMDQLRFETTASVKSIKYNK